MKSLLDFEMDWIKTSCLHYVAILGPYKVELSIRWWIRSYEDKMLVVDSQPPTYSNFDNIHDSK